MPNMNRVYLAGNLTKDPEVKILPSGSSVTVLRIAVNHRYKQGDEMVERTAYIDVEAWGWLSKPASLLSKSASVFIEGRLSMDMWETKEGEKRSKLYVMASNIMSASHIQSAQAGAYDSCGTDDSDSDGFSDIGGV